MAHRRQLWNRGERARGVSHGNWILYDVASAPKAFSWRYAVITAFRTAIRRFVKTVNVNFNLPVRWAYNLARRGSG